MSKRHTLTVIIVLGVAVLAVIILLKLVKPKAAEENKEVVPDVAVHVGKIIRATLHRYVTAYGSVEPEPTRDGKQAAGAFIAAPVSGILVQINCTEGRQVSQGTILFRLDSRVAEVEVLKAKKLLEFAEQQYERQQKLLKADGTSQKAFQEAEQQLNSARSELSAAQTQLALLEITAPLTGTLVRLNARLGQSVESNMVLAEIIDLDRLVVAANVPSREATILKTGQPLELGSGSSAVGTLTFIGKDVDPKNDTILVRAAIPAKAGFQPGQFLNIRIICEEHRDCLAVPEAAAVSDSVGSETGVIVLVEGNKAVRKPVKIGLREAGLVEVEGEGLKEDMIIVTEDAYAIPGETKIHIIS
jgi:membrane fusion protein (multidrug efflux system)